VDVADITRLSATDLLGLYRRRELSPAEATRAVLERIDAQNAATSAYCLVRGDEAMAAARQSERRWLAGQPAGLLDGVPVSVKDLLLTSGWPTLRGSLTIDQAGPWTVDAPVVARAVGSAVTALEEHGARVTLADPGFGDPIATFDVLWRAGAAQIVDGIPASRRPLIDPGLAEMASEGLRFSALDYLRALRGRSELGIAMGAFHQTYDLLVTPTEPIVAFAAGAEVPEGSTQPRWTSWTPFTYPFNLSHQPAATVPCGFSAAGLPIGVQVVGPRHADTLVLDACAAIEAALPWRDRWPPIILNG
jgi:Asp-tRNA(Asn)/Glu-tRNA(Gln) amidotransferase A subunit family amidase